MLRLYRRDFVGRKVVDINGVPFGKVADVWPLDGGGEPEMLLIKMGRFHRRRYVPVRGARLEIEGEVHLPWSRHEIDDAPDAEDQRWGEPGSVARAHWLLVTE